MRYPREVVDEVRLQNDIVEVISQYVPLKQKGSSYFGLCPFHNEKTASFSVNSEKLMNPQSTLVKDDAVSRIEIEPADVEKGKALSEIMRINGSFSSKISVRKDLMFDYVRFINETFIASLPQDFPRDILDIAAAAIQIGIRHS